MSINKNLFAQALKNLLTLEETSRNVTPLGQALLKDISFHIAFDIVVTYKYLMFKDDQKLF